LFGDFFGLKRQAWSDAAEVKNLGANLLFFFVFLIFANEDFALSDF